jgi:aspartyl-tRNA(Asn)/glutamyl-tRNA(Gln) amidotransferase subunit A
MTDAIMAGEEPVVPASLGPAGLRLGIPRGTYLLDDLDAEVVAGFERACAVLARAGARVFDQPLPELADYATINAKGGFSPPEAYNLHRELLARRGDDYDQRVRLRIARGAEMSAADYVKLVADRARFIAAVDARVEGCDALIVPTVAVVAPPIVAFAEDADFQRLNPKILRNPNVVNFLDRCAITLPVSLPGEAPVGLMLIGAHGGDRRLLAMAQGIEAALAAG